MGAVIDTVVVTPDGEHAGGAQPALTLGLTVVVVVIDAMVVAAVVVLAVITVPPYAWC